MQIRTAFLTDPGGRDMNDDYVQVRRDGDSAWIFVGDGLGGYAGGQYASRYAGSAMIQASFTGNLLEKPSLTDAIRQANDSVLRLQQDQNAKMKTTLVFLTVQDGKARWAHVGDSRLYHFREGSLQFQTVDHSVSQMAALMGEITPSQIRFHPDRNRILRALGSPSAQPEISPVKNLTGQDAFLLCTDGFWEYVYEEEMEQTLRSAQTPEQWLEQMKAMLLSRAPANHDNYTAAALFF